MFSKVYPDHADGYSISARHITEVIAEKISSGELKVPKKDSAGEPEVVSYHDSCRLGRYSEIYEAPRALIHIMPGVELHELERNRSSSSCCGVSGFINCDMNSKIWREKKLKEAQDVGAQTLLSGCPKCAIHLNCYLDSKHIEPKFDIKVMPVIVKLAEVLGLMDKPGVDK